MAEVNKHTVDMESLYQEGVGIEFRRVNEELVEDPAPLEQNPLKLRVHAESKMTHFPYPVSLLSFAHCDTLTPIAGSLRRFRRLNDFGDTKPVSVVDRLQYRVVKREDGTKSWDGYAPKNPIPEYQNLQTEKEVFSYGEVDVEFGGKGLEIHSFFQIPFTMYQLHAKSIETSD